MPRTRTLIHATFAVALLVSLTTFAGIGPVSAQEGAAFGDAVAVSDEEGTALGSIAVTEVSDPYTDFDPDAPPEPGSRYVALTAAFDADANERFDIEPRAVVLQDDAGFLWDQTSFVVPDDAVVPELSGETLAPGSRVSGLVVFTVPEGRAPARVFYQPENSRLLDLAELSDQPAPTVGDAVPIVDSEGGTGAVTVTNVADPFEAFDPTQPPPVDARFVLVTLTYENTGDGRFFIEPFRLALRDADGNLWSSTNVARVDETEIVPDLGRTQLAPGDRLSGVVGFAVPAGTGLNGIYAEPASGQLLLLADVREGNAPASDDEAATPTAALDEDVSTALADACVDVARWLETARGRIDQVQGIALEDVTLEDLATLIELAPRYAEMAEAQLGEEAPEAVAAVDTALAAALREHAAAVEQILGAADPGKDPVQEVTQALQALDDAGARMQQIETELASIASECGAPGAASP